MQPNLPPELLDYIFTFMRDDHPSLRNCALVNHKFSKLVERHLYYHITLNNSENYVGLGELSPAQISQMFTEKVHLVSHVKSLRIVMASLGILRWFTLRSMEDEDMGKAMLVLSQLTKLSLSGRQHGIISWNRFHHLFQSSFARLLLLPSMTSVSIHGIEDFPLPLLSQCKNLKSLSLRVVDDPTLPLPTIPTSEADIPRLEYLEILECTYALPLILIWLRSQGSPKLCDLRVLRIMIQRLGDISYIQDFLSADCAQSLKCLYVGANDIARTTYNAIGEIIYPPDSAPHRILDLSCLPNLRSLTLEASVKSTATYWISSNGEEDTETYNLQTPIPWIVEHLRTLFSGSSHHAQSLERIILELSFEVDKHALTRLDWGPLASVLKASQMWSLRTVQIQVVGCEPTGVTLETLEFGLRQDKYLSEMVKSGLLAIDTTHCPKEAAPVKAWWGV
ncbi:hypothetical protein JR316_0007440 [Psilocybe cubensis]|uniref:F-box domain-containing protein n=2 Tax=Psilocybe cubensis TaxID=181762 RepID=A0A8H8CHC9_PSICU|nr:hypothetical protein JR316_0007440 [Psilocybe cubensis]KAH9480838.1 hypothetical protein JR316_0007440 [Psilocybe cubensis]